MQGCPFFHPLLFFYNFYLDGVFYNEDVYFFKPKKKDHLKKYSNQDIIFLLHKILSNLNCVVLAKDLGDQPIPIFYRSEYSKRNFLVV